MPRTSRVTDNYDEPWKAAIERLFPYMMQFFHPRLHARIDWDKGFHFLNDDLNKISSPEGKKGTRYVDKLVSVLMNDGNEELLYIHLEVQSDRDDSFPERMYMYYYRLCDKYGKRIVSLAILGDTDPKWRPNKYKQGQHGCSIAFKFPMVKLLDYEKEWEELELSPNPFALVVMAHLKTKRTSKNQKERAHWKYLLMRMAVSRGMEEEVVGALYAFVDWVMKVPVELDNKVAQELIINIGAKEMEYINRWQQEGEVKGQLSFLKKLLQEKFGELPAWALAKVESATASVLAAWFDAALHKNSLEEVLSS